MTSASSALVGTLFSILATIGVVIFALVRLLEDFFPRSEVTVGPIRAVSPGGHTKN